MNLNSAISRKKAQKSRVCNHRPALGHYGTIPTELNPPAWRWPKAYAGFPVNNSINPERVAAERARSKKERTVCAMKTPDFETRTLSARPPVGLFTVVLAEVEASAKQDGKCTSR
ncbi:MAG: hypothetical protein P4L50_28370 [Anaerolineaceae bacterium]|jgi:hypothetical protein|nr:hypothetical protein [Anaerolineaceae bacterium]